VARDAAGRGFAGVMDEEDGAVGGAREAPLAIEHRGHLRGSVFVRPLGQAEPRLDDHRDG
jgi:hypothetical protein